MKKTFLLVCAFLIYAGTVLAQYPAISFFDGTQVTEDVEALKNGTNGWNKAATDASNATGQLAVVVSQTNQVIVVDGTAYIITNAPASAGDVLVFDPATTTAYFSAQAGGGLTTNDVKNVAPLMTNSTDIAIGKGALAPTTGIAIGQNANGGTYGIAFGLNAFATVYGIAMGREALGNNYGVAMGYQAVGNDYGIALGRAAYAPNYAVGMGPYSWATNRSVALGFGVTNTITNTTRVRGDLYLDGGAKIYVRDTFNNGAFVSYTHSPFQEFTTNLAIGAGNTATVTYACGSLVGINQTTNFTVSFNNTDYPTNGVNRVGVEVKANTNFTMALNYGVISSNSSTPALTHGDWASFQFRRTGTNKWTWTQIE